MPLDWMSNGVEDEDPSFTILDAIEDDFHWVKNVARLKIKGRKDVLNKALLITTMHACPLSEGKL
jgi:hypothetical protein